MNTFLNKNFWRSLLYRQNDHHRFGVFRHTMMVVYHLLKAKEYKMVMAALLHDIGKPFTAKADAKDIARGRGELSFTNHEELSYQIIKQWGFIGEHTKLIVRHHYLIRGMSKAKENGQFAKQRRLQRVWNNLSEEMKADLGIFLKADDAAKR